MQYVTMTPEEAAAAGVMEDDQVCIAFALFRLYVALHYWMLL